MIKLLIRGCYPIEIKQFKCFNNGLEVQLIKWSSKNYSVVVESKTGLITSKFHESEKVAKLEFKRTCTKIDLFKIIS